MPEPVLFIHGVKERDEAGFTGRVRRMNEQVGDAWSFVPVYWGNLGADQQAVQHVMPDLSDAEQHFSDEVEKAMGTWRRRWKRVQRRSGMFGQRAFDAMRQEATQLMFPFIGDVLVYRDPQGQAAIRRHIREALDRIEGGPWGTRDRPISVIAHSLGGVIAFEMALDADQPLCVRHLITMGSQPAFFFHLDRHRADSLATLGDGRYRLPDTIAAWTNVRHGADVLAFTAGRYFQLFSGKAVIDRYLPPANMLEYWPVAAHTVYWKHDAVAALIRETLNGQALSKKGRVGRGFAKPTIAFPV